MHCLLQCRVRAALSSERQIFVTSLVSPTEAASWTILNIINNIIINLIIVIIIIIIIIINNIILFLVICSIITVI